MPLKMSTVKIEIEEPLAALMHQGNQNVQEAGREMIVLELYRRRVISSGKAAELLATSRLDFIQRASRLGIPFFDMTEDEWEAEKAALKSL
jgi:predicted HTH domain antitoxin